MYILQYLLQFLLNVRYYARRFYRILNTLFRLFALKDKYNKNKLLILNKINNLITNIQAITKVMSQTFKEKSNLVN